MSFQPHLSIVVPAYNEARRLPPTLAQLEVFGRDFAQPIEVIIVVERSGDGTFEIASEFARQQANFRVIDSGPQRGKGHAVRTGMLAAQGAHIFYMDADLSVPLAEVTAFLAHFETHPDVDVLVANRQHAQSRITRRQSPLRERFGKTYNLLLRLLGFAVLADTQCGFKAFRLEAARAIFVRQKLDGFAFDIEVLLLAQRLGLRVADQPVEWINSAETKVRLLRDSWQMLRDTWRVRSVVARTFREELLRAPAPPATGENA